MKSGPFETVDAEVVEVGGLATPEQVAGMERREAQRAELKALMREAAREEREAEEAKRAAEEAETKADPGLRARRWKNKPANTKRGYLGDWNRFVAWAADQDIECGLPKELRDLDADEMEARAGKIEQAFQPAAARLVRDYLVHLDAAGKKTSTITRVSAAIGQIHQRFGQKRPNFTDVVREEIARIRDDQKHRPKRAAAITAPQLTKMLRNGIGERDSLRKLRDAALITLWFDIGARRAEMRNFLRSEIYTDWSPKHRRTVLVAYFRESKSDQQRKGATVIVQPRADEETCPFRTVTAWFEATATMLQPDDPAFPAMRGDTILTHPVELEDGTKEERPRPMSFSSLDNFIKRLGEAAELEHEISTHSVRAGTATFMLENEKGLEKTASRLRHRDTKTTQIYHRPAHIADEMDGIK